jgi:hypothetical protein
MLVPADPGSIDSPAARTKTDDEGRFQMTGIPAGHYLIMPFAPARIPTGTQQSIPHGIPITISEGEAVDAGDIELRPGGVITGRVVDADGQPLIQERVHLYNASERERNYPFYLPYGFNQETDDRGVYRLFGVPPGRYIVAAGVDTRTPFPRLTGGPSYYPMTYHPDVTDAAKATIVEVSAGSEATGVDIAVGKPVRAYSASGRIIDAVTGKPVAGMMYGYGAIDPQSGLITSSTSTSSTTNAGGEFRIDGVVPGRYAAFANPGNDSELYSELARFAVTDSDVTGLVVKVRLGSTLIGSVVLEGTKGHPDAPRMSAIRLGISARPPTNAPRHQLIRVAPDGTFHLFGLPPGLATFVVSEPIPKGIALARIERDGVPQKDGIIVGAGEEISDVRVVFAYGTGSIRGQVAVQDGEIPQGAVMYLNLRRLDTNQHQGIRTPTPDSRGRFLISGLQPGEYELVLTIRSKPISNVPGSPQMISKSVNQKITVRNEQETQVTMLVDLNPANRER